MNIIPTLRRPHRYTFVAMGIALLCLALTQASAQSDSDLAEYIKASYTKYEYEIEVRDGAKLFTAVYAPKDEGKTYPIILLRTPYSVGPYGVDRYRSSLGPSEKFAREGYIFAYQDVRGRYMSEGTWIEMTPHIVDKNSPKDIDESTDTYDTVDWLVKNIPNNNGNVGMWGISYPGFYAAAGMIDSHRALKVVSPQAPVADLYLGDDCYHNGAFFLAANFGFFTSFVEHKAPAPPKPSLRFDYKTKDAYDFYLNMGPLSQANEKYFHGENPYWDDMIKHDTYDDYWKARGLTPHLKKVSKAVITVGGWYDAEDPIGPLLVYNSIEENNKGVSNHLVMGPWDHGGWRGNDGDRLGNVRFNAKTSKYYNEEILYPFFDYHLNGEGDGKFPKAWIFETGTNQWRTYDTWPPKTAEARSLYLHEDGKLSFDPPTTKGFDHYTSDPAKPVPFIDHVAKGVPRSYIVGDQRFASKRPDVLVYQSDILTEDISIVGPITPNLFVSTSGTDSDFVVKLIDVYPNDYPPLEDNPSGVPMGGYQQLVKGEPIRAKFRNSLEVPEPMIPGQITHLTFDTPDISHVFRRGHRIMVQIQSSWFPLVDRNPQTFVIIPEAKEDDFQRAEQRLYRGGEHATSIDVLVVP